MCGRTRILRYGWCIVWGRWRADDAWGGAGAASVVVDSVGAGDSVSVGWIPHFFIEHSEPASALVVVGGPVDRGFDAEQVDNALLSSAELIRSPA